MNSPRFNVGAFVWGAPTSPRALVRHADLLNAYAAGERDDEREGYISHFVFGLEMSAHYRANRNSVAGFAGPCSCRWLVLDIDRADLVQALADARRLVGFIGQRYPELEDAVPIYFSGGKGFHVLVELVHEPPSAVGFPRAARTFAESLAARAGVKIDTAIYDVNHIVRLPNTRHGRTGLFKRRIDAETLFNLSMDGIRELAKQKDYTGLPGIGRDVPKLVDDWHEAERDAFRQTTARDAVRCELAADVRAPRYLMDFLRFNGGEGERHQTLFRSAAWLTEQGAPSSLVAALLTEPGRDVGLTPKDVERQIACGVEHARKQRGENPTSPPGDQGDAWEHSLDRALPTDSAALQFEFGTNEQAGPYGKTGGRR